MKLTRSTLINLGLVAIAIFGFALNFLPASDCGSRSGGPRDNPIATAYGGNAPPWTEEIRWQCAYNIRDFEGESWGDRFERAKETAVADGGGTIYFPAGTYEFQDDLYLDNGVVVRGETPDEGDALSDNYRPPTKFVFPKYEPTFQGDGTPNHTAFKKIYTRSPDTDSNLGLVNLDINRAGFYIPANIDRAQNRNIVVYGIRNNNVSDAIANVPYTTYQDKPFQNGWQRYPDLFAANIKINAFANVFVANNRLNDATTDTYEQPNYVVKDLDGLTNVVYAEGAKVPFDYDNHYGILINRIKKKGAELEFANNATPDKEPGLFREGIVIRDNWIYHTMRAGIYAAGQGLIVEGNIIRDRPRKQWWTDVVGLVKPPPNRAEGLNITYENRAIDWSGWNAIVRNNDYRVYRHQLMDTEDWSIDGEGILIQECCGGTQVKGVAIEGNRGNAYIGLFLMPEIRDVAIAGNNLFNNITPTPFIYVNNKTYHEREWMENVRVENNRVRGSILMRSGTEGKNNAIANNRGNFSGEIDRTCDIEVADNLGFRDRPCRPLEE